MPAWAVTIRRGAPWGVLVPTHWGEFFVDPSFSSYFFMHIVLYVCTWVLFWLEIDNLSYTTSQPRILWNCSWHLIRFSWEFCRDSGAVLDLNACWEYCANIRNVCQIWNFIYWNFEPWFLLQRQNVGYLTQKKGFAHFLFIITDCQDH